MSPSGRLSGPERNNGRVSPRAEFRAVVAVVIALVVLRSVVPLVSERSLDSDQAIVGLMAKHLSELRAFPLFFYGQNYMLGVQAWIAAPFFWMGGPNAIMLRLPLLLINVGVACGLIVILRRLGLRPGLGLVAALPLVTTSPVMSDALLRPLGAAVEPFGWILILWMLRHRPWAFGVVFCLGFLHREFVVYAAPALVVAQWGEGARWAWRDLFRAMGGFGMVWLVIDLLKRSINLFGPSGGDFASGSLIMQSKQIALWLSLEAYGDRVWHVISQGLPDMLGLRAYELSAHHGLFSGLTAGSTIAGAALVGALVVAAVRLLIGRGRTGSRAGAAFAWYLGTIGGAAIFGYGLNGGLDTAAMPIVRYALFVLLIPVAVLAAYLSREHRLDIRLTVIALVCVWSMSTVLDATRVVREFVQSPPANPHRELADHLVNHHILYARGLYWDAYIVTFLAQERVIVASNEQVRISAYGALVERHAAEAVTLVRQPCTAPRQVAAWCLE
jgi:hypothetical protein